MTNYRQFTGMGVYMCTYVCVRTNVYVYIHTYVSDDLYLYCRRCVIDDSTTQHDVSMRVCEYIYIYTYNIYMCIHIHIQLHAYIIDKLSAHHDVSINHRPIMDYLHEYIHTHVNQFIKIYLYICIYTRYPRFIDHGRTHIYCWWCMDAFWTHHNVSDVWTLHRRTTGRLYIYICMYIYTYVYIYIYIYIHIDSYIYTYIYIVDNTWTLYGRTIMLPWIVDQ